MKTQLFNDLMLLLHQQYDNLPDWTGIQAGNDLTDADDEVDVQTASIVKSPSRASMRVFTEQERVRFTKASYQFLVRLGKLEILPIDYIEMVINHLLLSDSNVITLSETKRCIRHFISDELTEYQLAFLDLVLYQKEDRISIQ